MLVVKRLSDSRLKGEVERTSTQISRLHMLTRAFELNDCEAGHDLTCVGSPGCWGEEERLGGGGYA